jgi:hypothetical protein
MIPKGISHTSVQNPTYEFQKRNISSIQENICFIQNYKGLSFLLVTLPLLVWQIYSLYWDLEMDSFVGTLCIWRWWSSSKIPASDAGILSSIPGCEIYYFFMMTSLGA